jgi:ABC-2 type transport system permease protein
MTQPFTPSAPLTSPPPAARSRLRYFVTLTRTLAWSEFKLRYAGSALGYFWSVSKPLLLFGVLYLIFTRVLRFGEGIEHYPVMLLLAIVLWSFFTETTSASTTVLVGRADLLRKISFPRIALPVSISATSVLVMFFNLTAVTVFLVINGVEPRLSWLLFPLLLIELYAVTLGVALLLSVFYVSFRDLGQIWELGVQMLFYATPIIYPLALVPEDYRGFVMLNPVAQIIQQSREVLVGPQSGTFGAALPGWQGALPFVIAVVIVTLGLVLFRRRAPYIAERV